MDTAKVFTNGRSQAVRIPKEYRFNVDEVYVNRIGEAVLLIPRADLAKAFDRGAAMLTEDFLAGGLPEELPASREEM